ncbi:MAG: hypothetical protein ABIJ15_07895 [bacterium]
MKSRSEGIDLKNEKFLFTDVKTVDTKFRLNLGRKVIKLLSGIIKADGFQVFVGSDGDILLRPTVNIPSRELWLYKNPEALNMVIKGLKNAKEGKVTKVKNLDKYLDEL